MTSFKMFCSAVFLLLLQNIFFGDAKIVGGFSEPKEANDYIKGLVAEIQPQVEAEEKDFFEDFEAISYSSQVVAGVNYWIKVRYNEEEYMLVKVHVPLPHTELPASLVEYKKTNIEDESLTPVYDKRFSSIWESSWGRRY